MVTPRNHFRYFALPAEIRNQIMEYILIPGDIYIRPEKRKSRFSQLERYLTAMATRSRHLSGKLQRFVTGTSLDKQCTIQQSDFHLLATCKQAYNDGHYMFYAMNTFHLPPGPVENKDHWFAHLRPEHQKMIKTIRIDLKLAELTYGDLDAVEVSLRYLRGGRPDNYDGNAWSREAILWFELRMWTKIVCLYYYSTPQNLGGLERVIVQSHVGCCELSSRLAIDEKEWRSLRKLISAVSQYFKDSIQIYVNCWGWRKTRKMLFEK